MSSYTQLLQQNTESHDVVLTRDIESTNELASSMTNLNAYMIAFLGTQSSGKSTAANKIFADANLQLPTGPLKTTQGINLVTVHNDIDQILVCDCQGHDSFDTAVEIHKKFASSENSWTLAQDISSKMSNKMLILMLLVVDYVVICVRASELQSGNALDVVSMTKANHGLTSINKPKLMIFCLNDLPVDDTVIEDRLRTILTFHKITDLNISGFTVKIVSTNSDDDTYRQIRQEIMASLYNKPQKHVPTLFANIDQYLSTLNKTLELSSFLKMQHDECQQRVETTRVFTENLLRELFVAKPHCLHSIDNILEHVVKYYYEKVSGEIADIYADNVRELTSEIYDNYKTGVISLLKTAGQEFLSSIVDDYTTAQTSTNGAIAVSPSQQQQYLEKYEALWTSFAIDKTIRLVKCDWRDVIDKLYVEKFASCAQQCKSRTHQCTAAGIHDVHTFAQSVREISCSRNCGAVEYVSCDSDVVKFTCQNQIKIHCQNRHLGCVESYSVDCDQVKEWICGVTSKRCCVHCGVEIDTNNCYELSESGVCDQLHTIACTNAESGCTNTRQVRCNDKETWSCGETSIKTCSKCRRVLDGTSKCYERNVQHQCPSTTTKCIYAGLGCDSVANLPCDQAANWSCGKKSDRKCSCGAIVSANGNNCYELKRRGDCTTVHTKKCRFCKTTLTGRCNMIDFCQYDCMANTNSNCVLCDGPSASAHWAQKAIGFRRGCWNGGHIGSMKCKKNERWVALYGNSCQDYHYTCCGGGFNSRVCGLYTGSTPTPTSTLKLKSTRHQSCAQQ